MFCTSEWYASNIIRSKYKCLHGCLPALSHSQNHVSGAFTHLSHYLYTGFKLLNNHNELYQQSRGKLIKNQ